MKDNIMAGANIMGGDGGYTEGNWEEHAAFAAIRKANLLARCEAILHAMLNNKELEVNWWSTHNKRFDRTPSEQWDIDYMAVYTYLMSCAEGEW